MDLADVVVALLAEARRADERRVLVLSGAADRTAEALREVVAAIDLDPPLVTIVGSRSLVPGQRLAPHEADHLLGTTRSMVVLDAHEQLRPNALGRAVGAVDGGGLLVILAPPLDRWPDHRDTFDETLAVAPFDTDDVTGRFRRRLVETLRVHPGIAVVDVDSGRVQRDGLTEPPPRPSRKPVSPPPRSSFPSAAYEACLTGDQVRAVQAFEPFHPESPARDGNRNGREDGVDTAGTDASLGAKAIVIAADRGRGKSSAAGLAGACLALAGESVLVTAPTFSSAREVFARAHEVLTTLEQLGEETPPVGESETVPQAVTTATGGRIRYRPPASAVDRVATADVVIVDEAAAIPVDRLGATLAVDRVAYATTVHGYEGTGRGFSVRFRDHLAESRHEVADVTMTEPVRYAPGDPIESWTFRALMLGASPPVDPLVDDAGPETVAYRRLAPPDLLADEHVLRETVGLLVLAHYRTEPDDLARLLDAPNLSIRALTHDGHVVAVALLAREGGLAADRRAAMYEGERLRGHMLPDILTSQLRDEAAGTPVGWRVMRIATHDTVRSRGLGSRLLTAIRDEAAESGIDGEEVDWLGAGFGATPRLMRFWHTNGYRTVHLSTTRNERSGEHSALVLDPLTQTGRDLCDRHERWFVDRIGGMLTDSLADVDPDVIRAVLRTTAVTLEPDLSDRDWRVVVGAASGPGMFSVDPDPFRRLALAQLVDPADPDLLTGRQERLLVRAVLQARALPATAAEMGFHGVSNCLRAIGDAYRSLVNAYGTDVAMAERDRFEG